MLDTAKLAGAVRRATLIGSIADRSEEVVKLASPGGVDTNARLPLPHCQMSGHTSRARNVSG